MKEKMKRDSVEKIFQYVIGIDAHTKSYKFDNFFKKNNFDLKSF